MNQDCGFDSHCSRPGEDVSHQIQIYSVSCYTCNHPIPALAYVSIRGLDIPDALIGITPEREPPLLFNEYRRLDFGSSPSMTRYVHNQDIRSRSHVDTPSRLIPYSSRPYPRALTFTNGLQGGSQTRAIKPNDVNKFSTSAAEVVNSGRRSQLGRRIWRHLYLLNSSSSVDVLIMSQAYGQHCAVA